MVTYNEKFSPDKMLNNSNMVKPHLIETNMLTYTFKVGAKLFSEL